MCYPLNQTGLGSFFHFYYICPDRPRSLAYPHIPAKWSKFIMEHRSALAQTLKWVPSVPHLPQMGVDNSRWQPPRYHSQSGIPKPWGSPLLGRSPGAPRQWLPLAEYVKSWQGSTQLGSETPIPSCPSLGPCTKAAFRNGSGAATAGA